MSDIGYYMVSLEVTPEGGVVPGAPVLKLDLGVNASTGQVNGKAALDQAIAPPNGHEEFPVSGSIHHTGLGTDTLLVSLTGQYVVSFPPPAIGSYLAPFSASFAVDTGWNGKGTYTYDRHQMGPCTVTNVSS